MLDDDLTEMKILLVEDDLLLVEGLVGILTKEGYRILHAETIRAAKEMLAAATFDLLILDIRLPDGNGLDFCRSLRKSFAGPILILTASDDEDSVVRGLRYGADDYVVKPFRMRELLARILALLRRSRTEKQPGRTGLLSGRLLLDEERQEARILENSDDMDEITAERLAQAKLLALTPPECRILTMLMRRRGSFLGREVFLAQLAEEVTDNALSVTISRLRRKLEQAGITDAVATRWGQGYRWSLPVREVRLQEERNE